jgi:putative IMPACT (imprinted ancient) family translation regulator
VAPESYPIPDGTARIELRVVNSRFIGSASYTPTVDEAKAFIA